MVDSYTTRIRLTKQGTGGNDSTWGTVLNDEVIELTDFAIAGYTTISLASGDVSLTSNDGTADESRSAMLELSGTLSASQNVYLPGVSKTYVVRNNTSGTYDATVLIDGGTGYVVPQGESVLIYSDSVSVRAAAGSGDLTGPVSSTDNALVRFNGVGGDSAQNSTWLLGDDDVLNGADGTLQRVNLLDYAEITNALGSIGGGTQDIDLTLGNSVTGTVDTSSTTFTFSNPTASDEACSFTLVLTNGGSQTVTWPASVDWPGGTAPTLTASGIDILVFLTVDGGTVWHGVVASAASA